MLHGIAAFNKTKGIFNLISRVQAIVDGAEICTANKAIGSIGVEVKGNLTGAFPVDVWSEINSSGRREPGDRGSNRLFDLNYEGVAWSDDVHPSSIKPAIAAHRKHGTPYAEFWEYGCDIQYVWFKENASEFVEKAARVIARRFDVPVLKVRNDYDIASRFLRIDDDPPTNLEVLEEKLMGY